MHRYDEDAVKGASIKGVYGFVRLSLCSIFVRPLTLCDTFDRLTLLHRCMEPLPPSSQPSRRPSFPSPIAVYPSPHHPPSPPRSSHSTPHSPHDSPFRSSEVQSISPNDQVYNSKSFIEGLCDRMILESLAQGIEGGIGLRGRGRL